MSIGLNPDPTADVSVDTQEDIIEDVERRATSFEPAFSELPDDDSKELDWAYGPLRDFVRMTIADDYQNLFMLDAAGGLGKTHQIKQLLRKLLGREGTHVGLTDDWYNGWFYKSGYTTPLALFETLWEARHGDVLFLDDMSGITSNEKCVEMLKAATDTESSSNVVTYDSSRTPRLGDNDEQISQFTFRGKIIMSFNETPNNRHYDALEDRAVGGSAYELSFSYEERIRLIREIAKDDEIADLSYETRMQLVDWIEQVTTPAIDVSIRTLTAVLDIREYAERAEKDVDWEHMCLEAFNVDFTQYLVHDLEQSNKSEQECIEEFCERTGLQEGHYYDERATLNSGTDL